MRGQILPICVCLATPHVAEARDVQYAIFDVGDLGGDGYTTCRAINNLGQAVGSSEYEEFPVAEHAYVWQSDMMQDLGAVSSCCSYGYDINEYGEVAGQSTIDFSYVHMAALWSADGVPSLLGAFDDDDSIALGMNDLGQIVGQSHILPSGVTAFSWKDGVMTDVGNLGGPYSIAWDVNNAGQVVGSARNAEGWLQAFVWQDGIMTGLQPLDMTDPRCDGGAINEQGVVAGISRNAYGDDVCVVWEAGVPRSLQQRTDATGSSPAAINESGDIVGIINLNHVSHACLWTGNEERVLDEHLPPNSKWTELSVAWDINEQGMIAGDGQYPPYTGFFDSRGWVMVPVTPMCYLAGPAPGVAGTRNILRASGVTPGRKVYFVYGLVGGGSVIPGCDLAETLAAIQIENAKIIGSATANAQGIATLNTFVPDAARNAGDVLIQAVIPGECGISQLVVTQFE